MHGKLLPAYCRPNKPLERIEGVVIHYFSGRNVDKKKKYDMDVCWNLFKDLNRPKNNRQYYMRGSSWPNKRMYASAHLLIGRDGRIWQLATFKEKTWHAGASMLNGRSNLNDWTIGIELVGDMHSGFTVEQYESLADQLVRIEREYGISRENVAGHDQVRWAAIQAGSTAKNKYDPSGYKDGTGSNFHWDYLHEKWNAIAPRRST